MDSNHPVRDHGFTDRSGSPPPACALEVPPAGLEPATSASSERRSTGAELKRHGGETKRRGRPVAFCAWRGFGKNKRDGCSKSVAPAVPLGGSGRPGHIRRPASGAARRGEAGISLACGLMLRRLKDAVADSRVNWSCRRYQIIVRMPLSPALATHR